MAITLKVLDGRIARLRKKVEGAEAAQAELRKLEDLRGRLAAILEELPQRQRRAPGTKTAPKKSAKKSAAKKSPGRPRKKAKE